MALESRDFTIEQGSTFILQFELTDDDGVALPTVVGNSIGNYNFAMKCRKSKYGGSTATLLNISGVTLLGTAASSSDGNTRDGFYVFASYPGRVKFVISSNTTDDIKYGRHDFDIEVIETKNSGVEITKALVGKFDVLAEATN